MISRAKDQSLSHVCDVGLVADQSEEPIAVGCVAVHDCADDCVVLKHKAAIDPARRIAEHDILAPFRFGKIARTEQITTRHFQFGRDFFLNECCFFTQQGFRNHFRLIIKRRDKAKDRTVVFDAFADSQNAIVRCAHLVIHMDAFTDGQTSLLCELDVGANANGHDQQITRQFSAIIQQ